MLLLHKTTQNNKFYEIGDPDFGLNEDKKLVTPQIVSEAINTFFTLNKSFDSLNDNEKSTLNRLRSEPSFIIDIIPHLQKYEEWEITTECAMAIDQFCIQQEIPNTPFPNSLTTQNLQKITSRHDMLPQEVKDEIRFSNERYLASLEIVLNPNSEIKPKKYVPTELFSSVVNRLADDIAKLF